jgi:hypothetical protein
LVKDTEKWQIVPDLRGLEDLLSFGTEGGNVNKTCSFHGL